jgi:peroxiredoxin
MNRPAGRKPLSDRTRTVYATLLVGSIAALVVTTIVIAVAGPDAPPPRATTLPTEYRNASPELLRAARAVGFQPVTAPGAGDLLDAPAVLGRPPSGDELLRVGARAPDFTLRTPTGRRVALRDFRGKVVLLEFFATWCPHCAAVAPRLRTLAESLPRSRYAFLSVDGNGADAASVTAYHVFFGLPFPALLDPGGGEPATFPRHGRKGPVSRAYGVEFVPTFYVLDREGRVTWRSDGEQPIALIRRELQRAAGF